PLLQPCVAEPHTPGADTRLYLSPGRSASGGFTRRARGARDFCSTRAGFLSEGFTPQRLDRIAVHHARSVSGQCLCKLDPLGAFVARDTTAHVLTHLDCCQAL